jgi:hypothetical protein
MLRFAEPLSHPSTAATPHAKRTSTNVPIHSAIYFFTDFIFKIPLFFNRQVIFSCLNLNLIISVILRAVKKIKGIFGYDRRTKIVFYDENLLLFIKHTKILLKGKKIC